MLFATLGTMNLIRHLVPSPCYLQHSYVMSKQSMSSTNRYSGVTRASKAVGWAAKGKVTEAPLDQNPLKPPTGKRKLDESTISRSSESATGRLEKPSAPVKLSRPKKPQEKSALSSHSTYGAAHASAITSPPPKKQKSKTGSHSKEKDEEKRLRVFRKKAPLSYLEKLERATSQRMFVIDRARGGTEEEPEETIDMAGTTGNIYSITISRLPKCTCPDNQRGNQCKHIVYVCGWWAVHPTIVTDGRICRCSTMF